MLALGRACAGCGGGCGGACRISGERATRPRAPCENGPNDADSAAPPALPAPALPLPTPGTDPRGESDGLGCLPIGVQHS